MTVVDNTYFTSRIHGFRVNGQKEMFTVRACGKGSSFITPNIPSSASFADQYLTLSYYLNYYDFTHKK